MGTARRQFTYEFKREAVGLLTSSGRPLSQIAQELGIAASRLRNIGIIPATAETENARRYRDDSWLGDLDSNQD
jgi:transposase-like protein